MLFNKRFLQVVAVGLLFLFPATLFAALVKVTGTASRDAIDTLTVEDNGLLGNAAVNVGQIIFQTDSLASATATRNKIVGEGGNQLNCNLFRISPVSTDQIHINATGGRIITTVRLNGVVLPNGGSGDSSKADQFFSRDDAGQPAPLPACGSVGSVPSLSFYGLIALTLALAGFVIWVLRRRMILNTKSV